MAGVVRRTDTPRDPLGHPWRSLSPFRNSEKRTVSDLGLVIGLASGAASAAAGASAASKNKRRIEEQTRLQHAAQTREFLAETEAANKDAYQATLEADRAKSAVAASGAGMRGNAAGLRIAEQARQGALSIANARDRTDAARANYTLAGKTSQIAARNQIA